MESLSVVNNNISLWDQTASSIRAIEAMALTTPHIGNLKEKILSNFLLNGARRGDLSAVTKLVHQFGANPNSRNEDGSPLLIQAVQMNSSMAVRVLLALRADVHGRDALGATALHSSPNREITVILFSHGADPNARDRNGFTPLHWFARLNDTNNTAALLLGGSQVNAKAICGETAMHRARHGQTIQLLRAFGGSVDEQDNHGYSPYHWAYTRRNEPLYRSLRENGARWHLETGQELSEIHLLAVAWGVSGEMELHGRVERLDGNAMRHPSFWIFSEALRYKHPQSREIKEIIAAFEADRDLDLVKRLGAIQRGELVVIQGGWSEHSIPLIFYRGYLIFCDRMQGTTVYKIKAEKMTESLLGGIARVNYLGQPQFTAMRASLLSNLEFSVDDLICRLFNTDGHQKRQKTRGCSYTSPEAALFSILVLQNHMNFIAAKRIYKELTTYFRLYLAQRNLALIKSGKVNTPPVLLRKIQTKLQDLQWRAQIFKAPYFKDLRKETLRQLTIVLK